MNPIQHKWEAGRDKNEFLRKFLDTLKNNQDVKVIKTLHEPGMGITIDIHANYKINIHPIQESGNELIWMHKAIQMLEEELRPIYKRHFEEYDLLMASDHVAKKNAKLYNILQGLSNNIHEIPELKHELIQIGKMLENDQDITSYCQRFAE